MPRIPSYTPQVQAQALSGGSPLQAPGPSAFGAGLGQGLTQAGEAMAQVAHQENVARAMDVENNLQQAKLDIGQWATQFQGKNALDPDAYGGNAQDRQGSVSLEDAALRKFDLATEQALDGLTEAQKQMVQQSAARFRMDLQGQVVGHVRQQDQAFKLDTLQGVTTVEDANVAQNALGADGRLQEGTIAQALARKVYSAGQVSDLLGEAPEARQARMLAAQSGTHALVLEALLKANKPQAAQVYFDEHKAEMDAKVVDAMEGKIQQDALANTVQAQADQITAQGGTYAEQDQKAQVAMKGNPDGLKLLRDELDRRFRVQRESREAAQEDTIGKLYDMRFATLPGHKAVGMPQIMRSPEWQSLDGKTREGLVKTWEEITRRDDNDPGQRTLYAANYYALREHPEQVVRWTPYQIAGMRGKLGPYVDDLLRFREEMQQPAKLAEAKADQNDINVALYDLKIDPGKDKEKAARFQDAVETRIDAEQAQGGGAALPRARKQTIIQEEKQKVPYWKVGTFHSSMDQQYPWLLKPEDMTVPPQDAAAVDRILRDNQVASPTNGDRWQAWQALLVWRAKHPGSAPAARQKSMSSWSIR